MYRGDLRSGAGAVFVDAPSGRMAVGLKADVAGGRLVVAGGVTGQAFLYGLRTGADLGAVALATTPGPTFINGVALTSDAAWSTDSSRAVLYRLPLLPGGGVGTVEVLELEGPGAALPGPFNLNGIAATPDGHTLVVMHSRSRRCSASTRRAGRRRPSTSGSRCRTVTGSCCRDGDCGWCRTSPTR